MVCPGNLHYKTFIGCNSFCNTTFVIEHLTLKNVNNCLNINIYSYLETSSSQIFNLYLNVVPF